VKEMTKSYLPGENFARKSRKALSKLRSFREDFRNREKRITADLENARKIWKKVGEKFSWWQSLP